MSLFFDGAASVALLKMHLPADEEQRSRRDAGAIGGVGSLVRLLGNPI